MSPEPPAGPASQLFSELYPQLRRIAASRMALQAPGHTLQPTALVHEAWIRLTNSDGDKRFGNVEHLFAAVSRTMRSILVDRARQRSRAKRGGDFQRVSLDAAEDVPISDDDKLLLVHESLCQLEKEDPVRARVVLLKFYGGLSIPEIAREMGIGERTVERYWSHAKVWLYDQIAAAIGQE